MTRLCDALGIGLGVVAVVGGGGKTSLIDRLCRELRGERKVLRLTTARMLPPPGSLLIAPSPQSLADAFGRASVVTVGERAGNGKLRAPEGALAPLFALADVVLIEADGSRGLPLKAPAEHEPALTGLESLVVAVAGVTGLEKPIMTAAHRPERYAALVGKSVRATALPADVMRVLESPLGQRKNVRGRFAVVLNQCDTPERLAAGRSCAVLARERCVLTALQADESLVEQGGVEPC